MTDRTPPTDPRALMAAPYSDEEIDRVRVMLKSGPPPHFTDGVVVRLLATLDAERTAARSEAAPPDLAAALTALAIARGRVDAGISRPVAPIVWQRLAEDLDAAIRALSPTEREAPLDEAALARALEWWFEETGIGAWAHFDAEDVTLLAARLTEDSTREEAGR